MPARLSGSHSPLYLLSESKVFGLAVSPGSATPLGGSFPIKAGINSSCGDPDLEVDNSAGASKGNIYAIPSSPATIYGWNSTGVSLGSPFPLNLGSGDACGLDVDNSGNIYVGYWSESQVRKYSPSGTLLTAVNLGYRSCKVAVDRTNGDLYVQPYSGGNVKKYTAASGYTTTSEIASGSGGNDGLVVTARRTPCMSAARPDRPLPPQPIRRKTGLHRQHAQPLRLASRRQGRIHRPERQDEQPAGEDEDRLRQGLAAAQAPPSLK